ncbi:MAG TPA: hypothetical protein VE995_07575 [Gaiellaceae bacterium]|nr:hypothetical protein [Gaiellaceae bacterium]
MSSTIEEGLGNRGGLLEVGRQELARDDSRSSDLAREIAAQQERLHQLRQAVLRQLAEQRRGVPRWPSGPKPAPALVDENEWWEKMLGRKPQAA